MAVIPDHQAPIFKEAAAKLNTMLKPEVEEDARLVQKGLMLYRQGTVHHLKYMVKSIWATVQDVTPVRVYINVSDPEESSCTCPANSFCRHRLAAFFQAYSDVSSVSDWVETWRKPAKEQLNAEKWGLQRAKDLVKKDTRAGHDYENWAASFRESFEEIIRGQGEPKAYVVPGLFRSYIRRVEVSAPLEAVWKNLYLIAASVHSFNLLTELAGELRHDEESTMDRYYRPLFEDLFNDAEEYVERLAYGTMPFSFDSFLEKLKEETIGLTVPDATVGYDRIDLYRLLWEKLFKNGSWRDAERMRLENFGDDKRDLIEEIALIHQLVLAKQDGEALKRFTALPVGSLPYMFYWLDGFRVQREWNRMGAFIEYLVQQLRNYLKLLGDYYACKKFTRYALKLVGTYTREIGRGELYDRALAQAMPYSFYEYEDSLFEKEQYEQWGELQSYFGFEYNSISSERIKVLQKAAPEVLIPLYHQMIGDLIEMKNRSSYKQAARLLKKLRTVYKKLKRVPEWEEFFGKLLVRTKRLRAFHEECTRSKLIEVEEA
ncbi:SWIM zinc finger family protein [Mesobacillus jeotgali]|uniref:SWIM zinc finger family protein n=1 Tax=Mesobacillus jeotgali TaxID=129985 RepID=UPI001784AF3C|nr:SWIM zinc finger family protein [Mesobacillus jeotgali]UYZ21834.1 SWIM zinc finger domain-containing protein [Mesobacillus jeotgali]